MKPLIAICVGHSRLVQGRVEGGAVSLGGVSEHAYHVPIAEAIHARLGWAGIDAIIVDRYSGTGYTSAMRWLANYLRSRGVTAAIELHFNSAGPAATGHEWLHWHASPRGRTLAWALARRAQAFPIPGRGVKPLRAGDRGTEFVRLTHCPAVIAEPFFGSGAEDWKFATSHPATIATALADGIIDAAATL